MSFFVTRRLAAGQEVGWRGNRRFEFGLGKVLQVEGQRRRASEAGGQTVKSPVSNEGHMTFADHTAIFVNAVNGFKRQDKLT
jgi:hypothetical protein